MLIIGCDVVSICYVVSGTIMAIFMAILSEKKIEKCNFGELAKDRNNPLLL